jgi:hypothetical protein
VHWELVNLSSGFYGWISTPARYVINIDRPPMLAVRIIGSIGWTSEIRAVIQPVSANAVASPVSDLAGGVPIPLPKAPWG